MEDKVLRLDVAVGNVKVVQIVDREDELCEELFRKRLAARPATEQVFKQLSPAQKLLDQVYVPGRVRDLQELDNVRVVELLQHLDLEEQVL